jgi:SAM-dependent methyltransferase
MMKPALAFSQPDFPTNWQSLPNGEKIKAEIDLQLSEWWAKFFGYHLAKIGCLSDQLNTENSAIKHQFSIVQSQHSGGIIAEIDDLPLLEHSVDVCLLSHVLEFSVDPHHVIREANRVLIPNGYLVITGFNPFSLAGLNKLIPFRRKQTPWQGRFFSPIRIKDWLHLMGFEILADQRCLHSSLATNKHSGWLAKTWQKLASNYVPSFGSIYIVVAKKRVLPLTPIKPKWRLRPSFVTVKGASVKGAPVKVPAMNFTEKKNMNNFI